MRRLQHNRLWQYLWGFLLCCLRFGLQFSLLFLKRLCWQFPCFIYCFRNLIIILPSCSDWCRIYQRILWCGLWDIPFYAAWWADYSTIFCNFCNGLLKNGQRIYNVFVLTVTVNKRFLQMLSENSYPKAPMSEITNGSGISKAMLFH